LSNSHALLRRSPIEERKPMLAKLVRPRPGIVVNEHLVGDGETVYRQACKLGCESIVSKQRGSTYRSGRSKQQRPSDAAARGACSFAEG
jgi:bifunctional non-homologous end joining protein LigD